VERRFFAFSYILDLKTLVLSYLGHNRIEHMFNKNLKPKVPEKCYKIIACLWIVGMTMCIPSFILAWALPRFGLSNDFVLSALDVVTYIGLFLILIPFFAIFGFLRIRNYFVEYVYLKEYFKNRHPSGDSISSDSQEEILHNPYITEDEKMHYLEKFIHNEEKKGRFYF